LRSTNAQKKTPAIQKRRFFYPINLKTMLTIGNAGFFFFNNIRFEFVYLKLFRRRFRITFKRGKRLAFNRKVWLNLCANYPISKKYKNARMGKGKGSFARWSIKIKPMLCFMEFFGFHPALLKRILQKSNYWFTVRPYLYTRQIKATAWCNSGCQMFINNQTLLRLV
jgi:hypothetical protein